MAKATYNEATFDEKELVETFEARGISADSELVREIVGLFEKQAQASYDEGHEAGHAAGFGEAEREAPWLDDLETGLNLLKSDPESAKVYLDRCTKHAGKYLIEVAPCLL